MVPELSLLLTLVLFAAGTAAGIVGALLGLGGGVFLVPFLVLVLHVPMGLAVGISLTTVIATSSVVSSGRMGGSLVNLRLGMVLEVATTAGGLTGGLVAAMLSATTLQRMFGVVAVLSALAMLGRLERRNVRLDPEADPGRLGGRYHEEESGAVVTCAGRLGPAGEWKASVHRIQLSVSGSVRSVGAQGAFLTLALSGIADDRDGLLGVEVEAGDIHRRRGGHG